MKNISSMLFSYLITSSQAELLLENFYLLISGDNFDGIKFKKRFLVFFCCPSSPSAILEQPQRFGGDFKFLDGRVVLRCARASFAQKTRPAILELRKISNSSKS